MSCQITLGVTRQQDIIFSATLIIKRLTYGSCQSLLMHPLLPYPHLPPLCLVLPLSLLALSLPQVGQPSVLA